MNREQIIASIAQAVLKDRQATHGNPENSFGLFAELVTFYLKGRGLLPNLATLQDFDCAAIQALLKLSRIALNPHHIDSWVDLGGYAVCGGSLCKLPVNENTMGNVLGSKPTATKAAVKGVVGTDFDGPMAEASKQQMISDICYMLQKKNYNEVRSVYVNLQP